MQLDGYHIVQNVKPLIPYQVSCTSQYNQKSKLMKMANTIHSDAIPLKCPCSPGGTLAPPQTRHVIVGGVK
jgi:hypothetical protein